MSVEELYTHIPTQAGLAPERLDAYNQWRRRHVVNRWTGEPPGHLVVRDVAKEATTYLLLDISAPATALVLKVGRMKTRLLAGEEETTFQAVSEDVLRKTKPTLKPLFMDDNVQALALVAIRGEPLFDDVMRPLGTLLRAPFYNVAEDAAETDPGRITVLSGDTSDSALVVSGWNQGINSSIVTGVQPLMAHSMSTENEAQAGAILSVIGGQTNDQYVRNMTLGDDLNQDTVTTNFDVLTQWDLDTVILSGGPLSFDPMFEPYMLLDAAASLVNVYITKLNELRKARDLDMVMTITDRMVPIDGRIRVRGGAVELTINMAAFRGKTFDPTEITMYWSSGTQLTNPAAFRRSAYAAAIHAFWLGQEGVLPAMRELLPFQVGLRAEVLPPGLRAASLALTGPIEAPPAPSVQPSTVRPSTVPGDVPPGEAAVVVRFQVIPSRTRFLRRGETLRAERELKGTLDSLIVEFLEDDGRLMSSLQARNIPLRQANVNRYPDLPYDAYYGIWYRSRAMGYLPKSSDIRVFFSAHDTAPSILVRLWGAIRVTARDRTDWFPYDLRDNAGLDDAYDVIFGLAEGQNFMFGFAKDKENYAALETVSVGRRAV